MKLGKILSKKAILDVDDKKTEEVDVPEWGGVVLVTTISGFQRDQFEASVVDASSGKQIRTNFANLRAKLCALCIVDEDGKRMFADTEVVHLGKKCAKALDRVFTKCQTLNGFSDEDIDALAKNSEPDQCDDSISV